MSRNKKNTFLYRRIFIMSMMLMVNIININKLIGLIIQTLHLRQSKSFIDPANYIGILQRRLMPKVPVLMHCVFCVMNCTKVPQQEFSSSYKIS
jgi:hypothetical protein